MGTLSTMWEAQPPLAKNPARTNFVLKRIAGNDPKERQRAIKGLKLWLATRSPTNSLSQDDFTQVWKTFFYAIWMSDKPLAQEECVESLVNLIHIVQVNDSFMFFKCALNVMCSSWYSIDQLRLNKFLMAIRRLLRQMFVVLKRLDWNDSYISNFGDILLETVLDNKQGNYLSLTMHFTEIYLEELAKVSCGKIAESTMTQLIKPFIINLAKLTDRRLIDHVRKFLFNHLLEQSDMGIEHQVKFEAWKARGFPGGTIDAMQRIDRRGKDDLSNDDEEEEMLEGAPLDPRAGCVDVVLPQLKFDAQEICQLLKQYQKTEGSTSKTRHVMKKIALLFAKQEEGVYPLGMKEIKPITDDGHNTKLKQSVNRLVKFEKQLLADSNKNRNRKRKKENVPEVTSAKKANIDEGITEDSVNDDELQKFIEKSERNVAAHVEMDETPEKRDEAKPETTEEESEVVLENQLKWRDETTFQRNSGTWIVQRCDMLDDESETETETATPEKAIENGESQPNKTNIVSGNNEESCLNQTEQDLSSKKDDSEAFVGQNECGYRSLKEKRAKKKKKEKIVLTPELKKLMQIEQEKRRRALISCNTTLKNTAKNKRVSLDQSLVKNPFAVSMPNRSKKVKIDLKLNQSQEFYEHHAQIQNSPIIPYDASKKPVKPLLKPSSVRSPLNPFYYIK